MRTHPLFIPTIFLIACGGTSTQTQKANEIQTPERAKKSIEQRLDAWHLAAANAKEEEYFSYFADDAMFLGTDAQEVWTLEEFHTFAKPHFDKGKAWTMHATRRQVWVDGDTAWFDEDLISEGLGDLRGSGVLQNVNGEWKIRHYNLTFTIPNEQVDALKEMLSHHQK